MCIRDRVATVALAAQYQAFCAVVAGTTFGMLIANVPAVMLGDRIAQRMPVRLVHACLLYTSDAADERSSVDLGGRRIIKKKKGADTSLYTR